MFTFSQRRAVVCAVRGQLSAESAEHVNGDQTETTWLTNLRARAESPAVQGLLALGIYLLVWVPVGARQLVHHPARAQLDQASPDPNFYVWSLRWWPYALSHGLNPLYTHEIGAPAGHALVWVTTAPALAVLASPLTVAAGPIVAFNLLVAAALPVSAWAAFALCRRLTGKFWPALVGGAVFGFSAYELSHYGAGQVNLTYSLLVPLLAYLIVVRWQEGISSRAFVILAAVAIAVQFYLFLETFADMTAILVVSFLLGLALAGRVGRPNVLRLARLTAVAYVIALVLAAPYLGYVLATKPPAPAKVTAMDLAALVIPPPGHTLGIAWLARAAAGPHPVSAGGYIGIPLLVLAVLLAATCWSSRLVRFLSCLLILVIAASLGPILFLEGRPVGSLPWAALFRLRLVQNSFPSRLMLFAFLVLAVATALFLAGPATWTRWARWPLAVLVIAAIALDVPAIQIARHTTVPPFISSGQYRRQLSPGEIVVVVSTVRNAGMLWQADSDFYLRLSGGFLNEGFTHRTDLPPQVQDLSHASPSSIASFEQYVGAAKIGAIVVDVRHEPRWAAIFRHLGLIGYDVGDVVVYPTDGCRSCRRLDWAQLKRALPATA